MQQSASSGKNHPGPIRSKPLGPARHTQKSQGRIPGNPCPSRQTRAQTTNRHRGSASKDLQRAGSGKGCPCCRRTRTSLVKKKDELGLKGPLKGHFSVQVKKAMVTAVHESRARGLTQKEACEALGLSPRKLRRWANPREHKPRAAWNKLRDEERAAIEDAAWLPDLIGKPVSHVFVHGHNSGRFFASLSTVYRVLKAKNLVQPLDRRRPTAPYVNAHALLDEGFSLLCYDGTLFRTDAGMGVWAIPVMILPQRYLIHIGHAIGGVGATDLNRALREAHALLPEHMLDKLLAHSDRGSAMKARATKELVKELLGAPVHFGRPHTPDDQAWIEAFIKTFKYHRDAPQSFKIVDDVLQWLNRFPDIYNNDPHSSLSYVTPLQALRGQKEVILNQRKQNLEAARMLRYTAWKSGYTPLPAASAVVLQPV